EAARGCLGPRFAPSPPRSAAARSRRVAIPRSLQRAAPADETDEGWRLSAQAEPLYGPAVRLVEDWLTEPRGGHRLASTPVYGLASPRWVASRGELASRSTRRFGVRARGS